MYYVDLNEHIDFQIIYVLVLMMKLLIEEHEEILHLKIEI
jgi:hypothetical protein